MTYTMVYRDYEGTFAEAAARMLVDPDIWRVTPDEGVVREDGITKGGGQGYAVDHWEWDGKHLRVWFR